MRTISYFVLLFAACLALWAGDKVVTLHVKPGLWEVTVTSNTAGQMPIPAGLLEKLTPDQRARIEDRMKSQSSQSRKPITYKRCLTQGDLDKGYVLAEDGKSCTHTVVSSTRSEIKVQIECVNNGVKLASRGHFEALDPENVKGHMESLATGGDDTMNASSNLCRQVAWSGLRRDRITNSGARHYDEELYRNALYAVPASFPRSRFVFHPATSAGRRHPVEEK